MSVLPSPQPSRCSVIMQHLPSRRSKVGPGHDVYFISSSPVADARVKPAHDVFNPSWPGSTRPSASGNGGKSNRRELDAHHLLAHLARLEPCAGEMRNVRRIGIEL